MAADVFVAARRISASNAGPILMEFQRNVFLKTELATIIAAGINGKLPA
ncbi:MAG: hypothetical protein HOK30_21260 [Rhodospirillaceae bacterium]|jgi:hypothetical protein|nr:hypothetical protein [Rhodospirillaceae bacterium]MBT5195499.1 hypothetical protein [Rhodospirillaceae bacterium]MBT5896045.1 hypothetical protein [Rhodospirillaceae bacterium]MBT6430213.1 hypothetical protein [Rhodospirillaceae bacterium]